ncbi:hypothetical protein [Romboutsia sp.]|uniref:hypothetical protein n=1 Tax=Romboutsia sp. TaxID=1965302 RepID=UPI003F398FA5
MVKRWRYLASSLAVVLAVTFIYSGLIEAQPVALDEYVYGWDDEKEFSLFSHATLYSQIKPKLDEIQKKKSDYKISIYFNASPHGNEFSGTDATLKII